LEAQVRSEVNDSNIIGARLRPYKKTRATRQVSQRCITSSLLKTALDWPSAGASSQSITRQRERNPATIVQGEIRVKSRVEGKRN
jgi:hypothetical protein